MTTSKKPFPWEAFAIGIMLLVYSNSLAIWARRHGKIPEATFRKANPALILAMLAYAAHKPEGLSGAGLRRKGLGISLLGGLGLGALLSGPPLLFFYRPLLLDTPLEYGPISKMTRHEMLKDVFVRVPFGIALMEELAFRGLLYSIMRKQLSSKWAIITSSVAFAGWHLAVTATSAMESNLQTAARLPYILKSFVIPLAIAGGMLTTGLAGVGFAWLRERTGNLAGPVLAHWIVDGLMIAALWLRRGRGQSAAN